MRKNLNQMTISGRIHSYGENGRNMLKLSVSGEKSKNPGTEFISGIINIATDEAGLNVVPVKFTYVTGVYGSSGKANPNFGILKNILENGKTWVDQGKDAATKIKVDGSIGLNEFYVNENGEDRLVSAKVNEGSFVTILNELPADEGDRTKFTTDMLITRINHKDADGDKIKEDYTVVGGAIFNFRNEILPIEYIVRNPQGMAYFESLELDVEPIYTKVWGKINCSTTTTTTTEESAFGEASVRTFEKKVREWIISGCSREGYNYGEEEVLTHEDITKAMANREINLAEMKKRNEEFKAGAQTAAPIATPAAPKAKVGGFNF